MIKQSIEIGRYYKFTVLVNGLPPSQCEGVVTQIKDGVVAYDDHGYHNSERLALLCNIRDAEIIPGPEYFAEYRAAPGDPTRLAL